MNEPHERAQIFKDRAKIGAHLGRSPVTKIDTLLTELTFMQKILNIQPMLLLSPFPWEYYERFSRCFYFLYNFWGESNNIFISSLIKFTAILYSFYRRFFKGNNLNLTLKTI